MTDQATLVESSGAFDATVDSRVSATVPVPSAPPSTSSAGRASTGSSGRTTVLPRVERGAEATTLVTTGRPRFAVQRALGEGGIGQVFAAVDQDIGREVAIKSLRHDMRAPAQVARFVDEIRTVGALEHPNIVPIHDVGVQEDGSLYFVMRCVQGETLEAIIERLAAGDPVAHAHWTMERRVHVFRQLLDAVAFAHDRGFVHRDIKPANVMVGGHGEVFLMDWGIAKPVGAIDAPAPTMRPGASPGRAAAGRPATTERSTATHAGALVGTPAYMSPEQARGEPVDARSDVYSLCVLFHELLCLRHYLAACTTVAAVLDGVQHAHAPAPSFVKSPHQAGAPMDLSWFVRKGLAKHASGRYQSVREMIDRLDAREEGLIPIQCHVTFTKRMTREWLRLLDRHPMAFTAVMTFALLAGVAAAVWRLVA
jgi:serine/threonine-protein kinase